MASTRIALFAAALSLFSSTALAFSPEQCNVTEYGTPSVAACNTLLTNIGNLGGGKNTSYLFIYSQYPTPAGLPNGTRKNFPQSWSGPGCNAAVTPYNITDTVVTYDTSTYQGLATAGRTVVQQCLSNRTRGDGGGWAIAGDDESLVLHLYASGSEVDGYIKMQNSTQIAYTTGDEVSDAEATDPDYGADDGGQATSGSNDLSATATGKSTVSTTGAASVASSTPASGSAKVVATSATFNYLGCQLDSASARTLSSLSWSGTGLTVQRCAEYCKEYQYMGVEFGAECYCGGDANGKGVKPATLVTAAANKCVTPCNGDATQICGGPGWLTVYQNTNSASAGATA